MGERREGAERGSGEREIDHLPVCPSDWGYEEAILGESPLTWEKEATLLCGGKHPTLSDSLILSSRPLQTRSLSLHSVPSISLSISLYLSLQTPLPPPTFLPLHPPSTTPSRCVILGHSASHHPTIAVTLLCNWPAPTHHPVLNLSRKRKKKKSHSHEIKNSLQAIPPSDSEFLLLH